MSSTSQGITILPSDRASGRDAFAERLALIGEGEFRAVRGASALAMPQAME